MAKRKDVRNLKVYEQSGYQCKGTPTILLKGAWLKELGFDSNMPIAVHCEDGKITIVPRKPEKVVKTTYIEMNGVMKVAEQVVEYR